MYFLVINYVIISRKPASLSRGNGIKDMIVRVCLNEYNEYFASIRACTALSAQHFLVSLYTCMELTSPHLQQPCPRSPLSA